MPIRAHTIQTYMQTTMAPSAVPAVETTSNSLEVKSLKEALVNGRPASKEPENPTPLEAISHGVVMPGMW